MMEENKELFATCHPDYEKEYHRLINENSKLIAENDALRKTIVEMCKNLFLKGNDG